MLGIKVAEISQADRWHAGEENAQQRNILTEGEDIQPSLTGEDVGPTGLPCNYFTIELKTRSR